MKTKSIAIFLTAFILMLFLCACDEAKRVNYNITEEATNFNIYRRVTVINCIKGDTLFEVEGWMNIESDVEDSQLEIIVEIGDNKYKKHFIGLSDNVTYTVEDITGLIMTKKSMERKLRNEHKSNT